MFQKQKKATLILEDGTRFQGFSFGYDAESVAGEVVFNTAMNGYPESLTDPSYRGQIMAMTFPLVGNYGVPPTQTDENGISFFMESSHIHMEGIVVSDYSGEYSHWNATESLGEWLIREKVAGITGVDTRALAKHLRIHGSLKGKIWIDGTPDVDYVDPNLINQVAEASCKEVITYGSGSKKVVLVDCGVKDNIVRNLIREDVTLIRVPWDYDFNTIDYDGLFLSNGPGNPEMCSITVEHIRQAIQGDKPICGICMGNQLLAVAAGAKIYKMKYGHRSHNQPVREVGTNRCFITSQNHGYAVDTTTLNEDWRPKFINLNDGTNEGICHKTKPFFSAQFHPEAFGGPTDTLFLFQEFLNLL